MNNPIKRNRNIGTSKQGYGQNNKLVIPFPYAIMKDFFERLDRHNIVKKIINEHEFTFIVEHTRETCIHACTINDIVKIIEQIPKKDYGDLQLIILRQPKRKEEILRPVWGRLIYSYEFRDNLQPAIILEAQDFDKKLIINKKMTVAGQEEFERLEEDGHIFENKKRYYEATLTLENVRNTQLYRTLPHEFGHYVHYLKVVERPSKAEEDYEMWEKRYDFYHTIPKSEKEVFAHNYANKLQSKLKEEQIIPFERIFNEEEIIMQGLRIEDFKLGN